MKLLAIDTATECCSAALLIGERLIARELEFDRGHAEHILPMVDEVLREGGVTLGDLDALAFGRGPGGFTGVRLAASVAQGLSFAAGLSVVPVSDLAAVAQRVSVLEPGLSRILICNDARMREVYWACFERGPDGLVTLVGDEHVGPPAEVTLPAHWIGASEASDPEAIAGGGRGFRVYPDLAVALVQRVGQREAERAPSVRIVSDALLPRAVEIVRLAVTEVRAGRIVPPDQAIPVYLRDDVVRLPSRN